MILNTPLKEDMFKKFFNKYKTTYSPTNKQIKSMQCSTVSVDADSQTTIIGDPVTFTARVDPPGSYEVNFKIDGSTINPSPILTDPNGVASLPVDTTLLLPGLYELTAEVAPPSTCTSSPLMVALTTISSCTGVIINNPSPIAANIGDIIHASATATITETSIIEFWETTLGKFGSCVANPPIGQCTVDMDTIGASPGTYSVVAKVGNGPQQCISTPVTAILTEPPGKIIAVSIPPGARIWYDDVDTGINTSAIISNVSPGIDHTIKYTLSGYVDHTATINIGSGETTGEFIVLEPSIPPTETGDLNVTSTPDGVEFGLYTGETGIAPTTITGILALVDAYEAGGVVGYSSALGSVTIKPNTITDLNIVLQPDAVDSGLVIFETIPMGADIYIDGILTGAKTSYATFIAPGPHTYEFRLEGYPTVNGDFVVVTGTDNPAIVSAVLQSESSGMIMLAGVAILGMMAMSK